MSLTRNAVPSSLRRPVESEWMHAARSQGAPAQANWKRERTPGMAPRALSVLKSRFARLPQEPEDARLTGVTRSLGRRLLALNLPGSRIRSISEAA